MRFCTSKSSTFVPVKQVNGVPKVDAEHQVEERHTKRLQRRDFLLDFSTVRELREAQPREIRACHQTEDVYY